VVRRQHDDGLVEAAVGPQQIEDLGHAAGRVADCGVVLIDQAPAVARLHQAPQADRAVLHDAAHERVAVLELCTREVAEQVLATQCRDAVRAVDVHDVEIEEEGPPGLGQPLPHPGDHLIRVRIVGGGPDRAFESLEAPSEAALPGEDRVVGERGSAPARLAQQLRERRDVVGDRALGGDDAVPQRKEAREERCRARRGGGRGCQGPGKEGRSIAEGVETRRGGAIVSEVVQVVRAQRIDGDQDDVRSLGRRVGAAGAQGRRGRQGCQEQRQGAVVPIGPA
jgi:hypothetical protein